MLVVVVVVVMEAPEELEGEEREEAEREERLLEPVVELEKGAAGKCIVAIRCRHSLGLESTRGGHGGWFAWNLTLVSVQV